MKKITLPLVLICSLAAPTAFYAAERKPPPEWEQTVKAAKAEKEVVVFCEPTPEARNALMQFQQVFPDIKLTLNPIGARDFATRVLAERRAGKYLADVFSGGTTSPTQLLVPAKVLEPIRSAFILPEVGDESLWFRRQLHFADAENQFVLLNDGTVNHDHVIRNTNLVRAGEIASLWDVLQPKWKGKIVAYDPRLPGGASNNMRFLYYSPKLGPNFIQRLFGETDITIGANTRQLMDWLANGKYALGVFIGRDIETALKQGLPVSEIDTVKTDGAMVSSSAGSISLINRAPHPNAAKVFVNWFLSREGQIAWQKQTDRNSLRTDIPKETIGNWKDKLPPEDGNYIFTNLPKYNDLRPGQKVVEDALAQAGKK